MDKLVIEGGRPLQGEVLISGSKNACLPMIAATILCKGKSRLVGAPNLTDVHFMLKLLAELGCGVSFESGEILVDASSLKSVEATYDVVRKMRTSVLVLGPLVARFGRARVSLPGGCAIGSRPVDQHILGLKALGAKINLEQGYIEAAAPSNGLKGGLVQFSFPSVGATEHIMTAACLAEGVTRIENAAKEPEIEELARALRGMGAQIRGEGTSTVEITGCHALNSMSHEVDPDRIEAGTYIAAAAITKGDILLKNVNFTQLDSMIPIFSQMGCSFEPKLLGDSSDFGQLRVKGANRLKPVDIATNPYPGFPTDMQAQVMVCATLADGTSHIVENIFENRFMHALELNRLGADIKLDGHRATVNGVAELSAAPVMATDLRASACLVLAALAAKGRSEISRVYHLDRGYVRMEEKLKPLGANIRRMP